MTRKTFTSEETAILRTSPAVIRTHQPQDHLRLVVPPVRRRHEPARGTSLRHLPRRRARSGDPRHETHRTVHEQVAYGIRRHRVRPARGRRAPRTCRRSDAEGLLESLDRMNDQLDCLAACVNVVIAHTRDVIAGMDATRNAMTAAKRQSARLRDAIQADRR